MSKVFRWWAIQRRLVYGSGFVGFWVLIGGLIYFTYLYVPTSCVDGMQNSTERGVDCGGSCVAICAPDVIPPRILWVESFEIAPDQYNVVAYIENPNQVAATRNLIYQFKLYDASGTELVERSGSTELPPNSIYPLFAGRVFVPEGTKVASTTVELNHLSENWLPATVLVDQFRTIDFNFENADVTPRLEVTIENTDIDTATDLEVVATVFNDDGTPVTASETYVEEIGAGDTKDVVFTWPTTIAKTVKSCDLPTDIAVTIDLSGSMNNDGGSPPQPITTALRAAADFVGKLKADDQAAVITFASDATTPSLLSGEADVIKKRIEAFQIEPAEDRGYTNTAAALRVAQEELSSSRHNPNARRVVVLLTDGLPTAPGDVNAVGEATNAAALLSNGGVEIYAIGLGMATDESFIKSIASEPDNAFIAPKASDLERIYEQVTTSLCESGPPKIEVIAKTKPDFTSIQ